MAARWLEQAQALSAGAGILALLAVLSVWIWTLAVVTVIELFEAARLGKKNIFARHALLCRKLSHGDLNKRSRRRLTGIHAQGLTKKITGKVGTILLLSGTAPLLGLLGTVQGMIDNFSVMARIGTADGSQLTQGISKALVTTQAGLLVAIPGLLAGGVLYRKCRKLRNTLSMTSAKKR